MDYGYSLSNNGGVDVPSTNVTFYEPCLRGVSSSTTITHLRIMGKGVKWSIIILVLIKKISKVVVPQRKKYSLDDMMMGSGFGNIHIRFGDTPKRVINDGNVHNRH
jgi:hypothetical protein